ncbi:MAG: GAF domain-containing protein [Elainellaceae cyanobacterium]
MTPEWMNQIKACCRDEESFERLKQLLNLDHDLDSDASDSDASDSNSFIADERRSPHSALPTPEHYQSFFQVIAQIRESLDTQTIFRTTAATIRQFLHADRAGIVRFNSDSFSSPSQKPEESRSKQAGELVAEDVVEGVAPTQGQATFFLVRAPGNIQSSESVQPYAVADTQMCELSDLHQQSLEHSQIRAYLLLPLFRDGMLWGMLYVHQCDKPRQWQPWEVTFVEQFAVHLDVALTQAELLQQVQLQTEQQQALFKVVTNIRRSLELKQIFKLAAIEVRQLLNADRTGIYKFDENSDYEWGQFVSEDVVEGYDSALETPVNDRCFGEDYASNYHLGQIQAVADIHHAGLQDCHIDVLAQFQVIANLVVPIRLGDRLWGLLCIHQCATPREWKSWEIEFVRQIAVHLGIALNQAELFNQTRQQSEKLAHTLEDLKHTQTQLIQTEKMSSLGQLVAGVAHEINNPVNFIYGNLVYVNGYTQDLLTLMRLYQKTYPQQHEEIEELSDEIELEFLLEDLPKTMHSMRVGAERIREIVLSLRNFARVDETEMKFADIHEGLESTLLILQHRFKASPTRPAIELIRNYGRIPQIECYPGQLNQVFMNILANAVDALEELYANDGTSIDNQPMTPPKIEVTTQQEGDRYVSIHVKDNGPGISYAAQSRLFDPFFTTKPVGKGTGLGLSISFRIVNEWHQGTLECCSDGEEGTEFRIRIPLVQNKSRATASERA